MGIPFKHAKADEWPKEQTYRPAMRDGERTANITCPGCGLVGSLSGAHTIGEDGEVSPSVVCEGDGSGCSFHAWITLEGWRLKALEVDE